MENKAPARPEGGGMLSELLHMSGEVLFETVKETAIAALPDQAQEPIKTFESKLKQDGGGYEMKTPEPVEAEILEKVRRQLEAEYNGGAKPELEDHNSDGQSVIPQG